MKRIRNFWVGGWLIFLIGGFSVAAYAGNADIALIDVDTLQAHQGEWCILDARPDSVWRQGHVPGALSFSWETYTRTDDAGVPYRVWPVEEMAKTLGRMGIDENTAIVVYGDADSSWGGEGWAIWLLSWLGHKGPLRLLDGGIEAWKGASLPLKTGKESVRSPVNYRVSFRSEVNVSTADLLQKKDEVVLIDTRSGWEWFRGRIPNAIHLSWKKFFTGKGNRPLSSAAYRKLLEEEEIPLDRPVVFYCTGGIRSGYVWLVHQLAGLPGGINYEGGTEAWENKP